MASRNLVRHHGLVGDKRGANGSNGGFLYAGIPMELARDTSLSANARSIALLVWSHDAAYQQSAADIAKAMGMSRNTVSDALKELEDRRWMVREVHYKLSKNGNSVWDREIWHLQMSNVPFPTAEIERLKQPALNESRSVDRPALRESRPALNESRSPALNQSTIEMDYRDASKEMHLSNANTDLVETASYGRSLTVGSKEATAVADGKVHLPIVNEGAAEAPEEDRPDGLRTLLEAAWNTAEHGGAIYHPTVSEAVVDPFAEVANDGGSDTPRETDDERRGQRDNRASQDAWTAEYRARRLAETSGPIHSEQAWREARELDRRRDAALEAAGPFTVEAEVWAEEGIPLPEKDSKYYRDI